MPFSFLRLRTLRKMGPAANIKADCAEREPIPPHQFRAGECGTPTRRLIVRVCATIVLAACLVSGLATGIRDAAAVVSGVTWQRDLAFGLAAGDVGLPGTVVISPAGAKTVTGGATDLGGADGAARFRVSGTKNTSYSCTLPGSILVTSGANSATVDTFTTSPGLTGNLGPSGKVTIDIGATLHLAAGQAAGTYSGTFDLTCDGFSGTANVTVTLIASISISAGGNLEFGTVSPTGTAGTVTVTPAGARSSVNVDLLGGLPAAASFDVTGGPGQAYSITLPPDGTVTLTGLGAPMGVDAFNHDAGGTPTLVGGSDTFNVGATLNVGAAQAADTYSGTFAVTVNYN